MMSRVHISQTCPVGDCRVTVTWEFAKVTAKQVGFVHRSKRRLTASLVGSHTSGNHDLEKLHKEAA